MKESHTHNTIEIFSYTILLGTILSYHFIVLTSPHRGVGSIWLFRGRGGGFMGIKARQSNILFFSQPVITQSVKFSFALLVAITLLLIVCTFSLVFLFYVCCQMRSCDFFEFCTDCCVCTRGRESGCQV